MAHGENDLTAREAAIRERVDRLPQQARQAYFRQLERDLKDPDTFAALNWFFVAGLHWFYLRRPLRGAVDLAVFLVGALLLVAGLVAPDGGGQIGLGLLLLVGITLVELPALFRSRLLVRRHNIEVREAALARRERQGH